MSVQDELTSNSSAAGPPGVRLQKLEHSQRELVYFWPSIYGLVTGIVARQDIVPDVLPPIPVTRFFMEDLSEKTRLSVLMGMPGN